MSAGSWWGRRSNGNGSNRQRKYDVVPRGGHLATTSVESSDIDAGDASVEFTDDDCCDRDHDDGSARIPSSTIGGWRSSRLGGIVRLATSNLLDDGACLHAYRRGCRVEDSYGEGIDDGGLVAVKLVKFWTWSIIGILLLHPLARWMGWEIDENYTLRDFVRYDFHVVLLDLLFFFVVGRLHDASCRGIDCILPWGVFIALGAVYPSISNDFEFLRHSVSMYDINCGWPAILFVYAFFLLVLSFTFAVALARSHHRRMVLRSRIVEVIALFCLFILPYATLAGDSLHLHHWFVMWWLGMQSNSPEFWARSFQAYAIGSYINGIAVYGRDPILECKHAFYVSTSQHCAFMQCYESKHETEGDNKTEYKEFITADWRLCNAESLSRNESFV
ncbi:hypothetical protein ACHAXA_005728 [Cyclostephanos tholiformis]|uniref:Uncharacterized protein n=1 Tax=Cyclostephanos tholiformis TaxID=382380 RepID=A0ABD3R3Z9_9STRA